MSNVVALIVMSCLVGLAAFFLYSMFIAEVTEDCAVISQISCLRGGGCRARFDDGRVVSFYRGMGLRIEGETVCNRCYDRPVFGKRCMAWDNG